MAHGARRLAPIPGGWVSIAMIYCYGVLTSASLSKVIPVLGDVGSHLGATPAQLALLISLLGLLPAFLASAAGSIIDRIGAPHALRAAAFVGMLVNAAYLLAPSLSVFMWVRVVEGLISTLVFSAGPALIMATTGDARRARAMAVWSTYTPTGFSLGLVMAGHFAGTGHWRGGYLVHLLLFALLLLTSWALPRVTARPLPATQRAGLFSAWAEVGPLRLAMTFALLVLMGFGMSSVYPAWYSRQHGVTPGAASTLLGIINLAMIPAGFFVGAMIARGWRDTRTVGALLCAAAALSWPLFHPAVAALPRLVALVAWMVAQGAVIAAVTSALPRVIAHPGRGAAAAGLLSQLAAAMTFVTPLVWQPILQRGWWPGFMLVTVLAALAAWVLFPRVQAPATVPLE